MSSLWIFLVLRADTVGGVLKAGPLIPDPVLGSADIGLAIAGKGSDAHQPDNNVERVFTLRPCDPNVAVQWWRGAETLQFRHVIIDE